MRDARIEEVAQECARKKSYPTEKDANRVRERCRQQRGVELKVYGCPHCGQYHLAKLPRVKEV